VRRAAQHKVSATDQRVCLGEFFLILLLQQSEVKAYSPRLHMCSKQTVATGGELPATDATGKSGPEGHRQELIHLALIERWRESLFSSRSRTEGIAESP
jgi:hypothetical protein